MAESPTAVPDPAERWWRLRHLPSLLLASGLVLVAGALVGWMVRGVVGAVGVALGVGLVALSYTASTVVIAWADSISPQLVLPFGLGVYVAKFSLFGGLMILVSGTDWPGLAPMGWGIVAGVVGWTAAQIWWIATVHMRSAGPR